MKYIKLFETFINEDASFKVPTKITNIEDLDKYFHGYEANLVKNIWGSNNTIQAQAINSKEYSIKYVFKGMYNKYLELKVVK